MRVVGTVSMHCPHPCVKAARIFRSSLTFSMSFQTNSVRAMTSFGLSSRSSMTNACFWAYRGISLTVAVAPKRTPDRPAAFEHFALASPPLCIEARKSTSSAQQRVQGCHRRSLQRTQRSKSPSTTRPATRGSLSAARCSTSPPGWTSILVGTRCFWTLRVRFYAVRVSALVYAFLTRACTSRVLRLRTGRDATREFEDVGHSADARTQLEKLVIGTIRPATEEELRISKLPGGAGRKKRQASTLKADVSQWVEEHSSQIKTAGQAAAAALVVVYISRRYILPYLSGSNR